VARSKSVLRKTGIPMVKPQSESEGAGIAKLRGERHSLVAGLVWLNQLGLEKESLE
jgi:hypothetical protein